MPCLGDSEGQVQRQGDSGSVGEHGGEGDGQGDSGGGGKHRTRDEHLNNDFCTKKINFFDNKFSQKKQSELKL